METQRHIGIDLHRNKFTRCVRLENGRNYLTDWKLEDLARFTKNLRPSDEVAVEVTGNTRLFYEAVAPHVSRVVAVDPNQFRVISQSVKKTDPNDARNLALYLEKDLLPEVRMKDKTQAQLASLTQTRDTLVKLRTSLKNKINNILSAHEEVSGYTIQTTKIKIPVPSVVRLMKYRRMPRQNRSVSRKGILLRDGSSCQYCGARLPSGSLTLDHVVPRSRRGLSTWENLVACCFVCNNKKGERTPQEAGMVLARQPRQISIHAKHKLLAGDAHTWDKYLFA